MANMCEARLERCKLYMRIDGSEEDTLITALMGSAEEYLTGAGILPSPDNARRYELALFALTLYYYDHRDAVGSEAAMPKGIRPVLTQLKLESAANRAAERAGEAK